MTATMLVQLVCQSVLLAVNVWAALRRPPSVAVEPMLYIVPSLRPAPRTLPN
jgi:hypothetical protein